VHARVGQAAPAAREPDPEPLDEEPRRAAA
jgi:hypothetical protein